MLLSSLTQYINIGIIIYCIGNSQWCISNTQSKFDWLSSLCQSALLADGLIFENNEEGTLNIKYPMYNEKVNRISHEISLVKYYQQEKQHAKSSGDITQVEYTFTSRDAAKSFWKTAVENHSFFRKLEVKPRRRRSRGTLLSSGSSFRYIHVISLLWVITTQLR